MSKIAVFLYDFTGLMAQPWLSAGYLCYSFDGQHPSGVTEDGNHIKVGMWFDPLDIQGTIKKILEITGPDVQFIFGFPDCTQLTVTGAKHWHSKSQNDRNFQLKAIRLADMIPRLGQLYGCPWAFENPKGKLNSFYRSSDYKFDPYQYGDYLPSDDIHPLYPQVFPPQDAYYKETHIWAGNNFRMPDRRPVPPLYTDSPGQALVGARANGPRTFALVRHAASPKPYSFSMLTTHGKTSYDNPQIRTEFACAS